MISSAPYLFSFVALLVASWVQARQQHHDQDRAIRYGLLGVAVVGFLVSIVWVFILVKHFSPGGGHEWALGVSLLLLSMLAMAGTVPQRRDKS